MKTSNPIRKVELTFPSEDGRPGQVVVDGADLSSAVQHVSLDADARGGSPTGRLPRVVLDLTALEASVTGEATVVLSAKTQAALRLLGWERTGVAAADRDQLVDVIRHGATDMEAHASAEACAARAAGAPR